MDLTIRTLEAIQNALPTGYTARLWEKHGKSRIYINNGRNYTAGYYDFQTERLEYPGRHGLDEKTACKVWDAICAIDEEPAPVSGGMAVRALDIPENRIGFQTETTSWLTVAQLTQKGFLVLDAIYGALLARVEGDNAFEVTRQYRKLLRAGDLQTILDFESANSIQWLPR